MGTIESLEELLELIEDHDSDFWETEISDLDGQPCKVIHIENATRMINEYAKNRAIIQQPLQPDNGYVCNRPGQCAKGQGGKCYSGFDCPDKAIAG